MLVNIVDSNDRFGVEFTMVMRFEDKKIVGYFGSTKYVRQQHDE